MGRHGTFYESEAQSEAKVEVETYCNSALLLTVVVYLYPANL